MSRGETTFGHNLAITAAANLATPAAAVLTAPLLARVLGVDGRGELAAATAPFLLMVAAATFGLPEAVIYFTARRVDAARQHLRTGVLGLAASGAVAMLLTFALARWFAADSSQVTGVVMLLAGVIPFAVSIGALRGTAAGLQRWDLVAIEKVLTGALRLVATYLLAAFGQLTVLTAALAIAIPVLVSAAAYLPLRRLRRERTRNAAGMREMAGYGWQMWGGAIAGILLTRLDQVLLAPLAGAVQLGYYTVAVSVADVSILANSAMRDVTLASDAAEQDNRRIFRTARVSLLVALAVALLVVATLWLWFDLVFGTEFSAAVPMCAVLILGAALATPGSVLGAGLSARGYPGLRSLSLGIACVANLVLLVLLAPRLGGMGAAWATVIGGVVASSLNIVWFFRRFGGTWREVYLVRADDAQVVARSLARMLKRAVRRGG